MKVIINDISFKPIVCTTKKSIEEGMMRKTFNNGFDSMLFMLGESKIQSFWMFNCIIPLDIIMISPDNTITQIHSNCLPCQSKSDCISYQGYGDKVLEIYGGSCEKMNIFEGDDVLFSFK